MKKVFLLGNLLFALTLTTWLFFDYLKIIHTPLGTINHWIPEYALITLIIYKWKMERKTRMLWASFIYIVSYITITGTLLGATIFQRLATMTVFLSALWFGLLFGYLKNRGGKQK